MSERSVTRRDVLRTTGGLATVGALGSLAGCSQVTDSLGGGGGKASIETVPQDSQYVLETDFTALYGDDGLREGINEELSAMREEMQSDEVPENVTAALDRIESEAGLDPRSLSKSILSGTYEAAGETDQTAYTFWSEWTEDDLLSAIETEGGSYTEDSYSGTTLYVEGSGSSDAAVLAVLAEGVFSVGTRSHVEATIDTDNGDADPISGEVKSGYDASTDGHVRYAFDVVASEVPESTGGQFNTSVFKEVTHGYGSLSEDGDDRVATLQLEASGSEAATDVSDILQGALTLAEQQVKASETEGSQKIVTALDATEVSADGTTATVTHARPAGEFAAVATPILLTFVMSRGNQPQQRSPQVSFGFEFDPERSVLTITHEAGDTVPASELYLRGTGFQDVSNVDQTSPGQWQGDASGEGDVRAGDSVTVGVSSEATISVVWQSADGGESATLARYQGPDA